MLAHVVAIVPGPVVCLVYQCHVPLPILPVVPVTTTMSVMVSKTLPTVLVTVALLYVTILSHERVIYESVAIPTYQYCVVRLPAGPVVSTPIVAMMM